METVAVGLEGKAKRKTPHKNPKKKNKKERVREKSAGRALRKIVQ